MAPSPWQREHSLHTHTKALLPPDRPVWGPDGEASVPEKGCILWNSLPICLHSTPERAPCSFSPIPIPSQQVVFLPLLGVGRGFLLFNLCSQRLAGKTPVRAFKDPDRSSWPALPLLPHPHPEPGAVRIAPTCGAPGPMGTL